jgi:hypothetical protein
MIRDIEFEILSIYTVSKPYVYDCRPINVSNMRFYENYYHESDIKKKTGLLKELE